MSETDSSNIENNSNLDDWKSWLPEEVLLTIIYEFRTPLMIMESYAGILSNETAKEHHPKAVEAISNNIERILKMNEEIAEYLIEYKKKTDAKP